MSNVKIEYKDNELTVLYLIYKETNDSKQYIQLYEKVMYYAYNFPLHFSQKNIEYSGDFLIYMKPKLSKIIERFQYYGNPLEGYLYKTCRGQFLTFIKNYNDKEKKMRVYQENYSVLNTPTHIIESYCESNVLFDISELYNGVNIEIIIQLFRKTPYFKSFKHRFWILLLKYSTFLDDSRCYELAEQIDIHEQECKKTLARIKGERAYTMEKRIAYKERCNRLYSRCIDKEMVFAEQTIFFSPEEKKQSLQEVEQKQRTFIKHTDIYTNNSFILSNELLAVVLHQSKGSIDSSLFHLKKMTRKLWEKHIENGTEIL